MSRTTRTAPPTWPDLFLFGGAATLLIFGWMDRHDSWINAEEGLGYALGILGGSMMLGLVLYPLRKKMRWMAKLGPVTVWFRTHMWLGVLGPVAVLFHSRFQLGSLNSNVALFAMATVALSGLAGRYFYTKVHRSLYATRLSLSELRADLGASRKGMAELLARAPELDQALRHMEELALTPSFSIGAAWRRAMHLRLLGRSARRTLRRSLSVLPVKRRGRYVAKTFVRHHLKIVYRIVDLALYDRLLALWHLLHLPLFTMLVLAGWVHVLAVHMY